MERVSHYQVERLLGRGGMGEVHEAVDLNLDRRVALKFIAPEFSADGDTLKRFEREARSAASLNHPNIATLYAFERGERPLIAMELLSGETLRARMRPGPLPIDEALGYARDVAAGLALAHRRGVVHRDVKPENLMFDADGVIKIVDFGLARAAQASRLTMTGSTLGTAAYMSPEAVRGEGGAPSDVWALGVILYEMIAGALPFAADDNPLAMMYVIANEPPRSITDPRPETPEEVAALIGRILEKDPDARPPAAEIAMELAVRTGAPRPAGLSERELPASNTAAAETDAQPAMRSSAPTAPLPAVNLPGRTNVTEELEAERIPAGVPATTPGGALAPRRAAMRTRFRLAIVLAALVIAGTVAIALQVQRGREEGRRAALRLNNEGQQRLTAGDLVEARDLLERALSNDRSNGPAMLNLAQVYQRTGFAAAAESLYSAVLDHHASDTQLTAQAHYNLGSLDLDARAWDSAISHMQESMNRDSSWAGPYNGLGFALVQAGRVVDGESVLRRGIARFPGQAVLLKNHGLALMKQDVLDGALADLGAALRLEPGLGSAHGVRAMVRARTGDRHGALDDFRAFAASTPPPADMRQVAADLLALGVTDPEIAGAAAQ